MSKKGLIFVAHGSRNPAGNDHIAQITNQLTTALTDKYNYINYAFLEFSNPTIADTIETQIQQGATDIVIFPYFLSPGNHVVNDIPSIINSAQTQHTAVSFNILPPFGLHQDIIDVVISLLRKI